MKTLQHPSDTGTSRNVMRSILLLLAILAALGSAGCDNLFFDVGEVSLQPVADADTGDVAPSDVSSDAEDGDTRDVREDAPDRPDANDAADVPDTDDVRDTFDGGDGEYPFGDCNPVTASCPSGEYCKLRFEPGNPPRLYTACDETSSAGTAQEGQSCASANDCKPQTYCVNWAKPDPRGEQCTSYCILATGEGCAADEFCTNPFDILDGLGFCTKICDPLAADCPAGTQCHPHSGYSSGEALEPHFQCLAVDDDFSSKGEGSSCDVDNVNLDGCAPGLVCYPVGSQNMCVKPCSDGVQCDGAASCGGPAGDWGLRYCTN